MGRCGPRGAVTTEVASSSLVVPAIPFHWLARIPPFSRGESVYCLLRLALFGRTTACSFKAADILPNRQRRKSYEFLCA